MVCSIKSITPAMAEELLKKNIHKNRKVDRNKVNTYCNMMKKNQWKSMTGEAIKISLNGNLVDGQHRLLAVIKFGEAVEFLVIEGVADDAFEVLDTGKKRTPGDALAIHQIDYAKNSAAIIGAYYALSKGRFSRIGNKDTELMLSNNDLLNIYQQNPDFWKNLVAETMKMYKEYSYTVTHMYIGSWYAYLAENAGEKGIEFMQQLCSGLNLNSDKDPIKVLRSTFILARNKTNFTPTTTYRAAITIKAWNAFITGREISKLNYNDKLESFPKIIWPSKVTKSAPPVVEPAEMA